MLKHQVVNLHPNFFGEKKSLYSTHNHFVSSELSKKKKKKKEEEKNFVTNTEAVQRRYNILIIAVP